MKNLSLFPLNLVAFPGENLNLHIFEPRYKQLINDCLEQNTTFGIPSYINNKIEVGTEVEIVEVFKVYDDGRMDIRTLGTKVFKVHDFWNPWGDKTYAGGSITYLDYEEKEPDLSLLLQMKELASQLFSWLHEHNAPNVATARSMFDIGHKIGFKLEEEYQLLQMKSEDERLDFSIKHLERLIPALERANLAQEKIKQNGHFKHLDPLKF